MVEHNLSIAYVSYLVGTLCRRFHFIPRASQLFLTMIQMRQIGEDSKALWPSFVHSLGGPRGSGIINWTNFSLQFAFKDGLLSYQYLPDERQGIVGNSRDTRRPKFLVELVIFCWWIWLPGNISECVLKLMVIKFLKLMSWSECHGAITAI